MRRTRPFLAFALLASSALGLAACRTAPPPAAAPPEPRVGTSPSRPLKATPIPADPAELTQPAAGGPTLAAAPEPTEVHYGFLSLGQPDGLGVDPHRRRRLPGLHLRVQRPRARTEHHQPLSPRRQRPAGLPGDHGQRLPEEPRRGALRAQGGPCGLEEQRGEGERDVHGPAFFLSLNAAPQELALLAKALLAAPEHTLPLLRTGEARLEEVSSSEVRNGGGAKQVHLYALSGLGFTPTYVWLDDKQNLFPS